MGGWGDGKMGKDSLGGFLEITSPGQGPRHKVDTPNLGLPLHQVGPGLRTGGTRAGPQQYLQSIQQHIWLHLLHTSAVVW